MGGTGGGCEEGSAGAGGAEVRVDANWAHWSPNPLDANRWNHEDAIRTDDTVVDPVTELQWQLDVARDREKNPEPRTWEGAKSYCDELSLEGHCDWRLPSRIELVSIVDYKIASPAIPKKLLDKELFHGTANDDYLWSLPFANPSPLEAWRVHVEDGSVASSEVHKLHHVRCVRAGKLASGGRREYAFGTDQLTVIDEKTHLVWQRDGKGDCSEDNIEGNCSQSMADNYCETLDFAGSTSWRLPTVQELQTIVDHSEHHPAIDQMWFREPDEDVPGYWSSTVYFLRRNSPPADRAAWSVSFQLGYAGKQQIDTNGRVRCVHDWP
ncbi:DUF1566 domain-containing protein [Sorangium sp. So ce321]|uniref:Lcl C-terminal domain-containing protein n=1 Tax=Sorangium sp. So ce321 TaxID=3133300 RepID=UPI003F609AC1